MALDVVIEKLAGGTQLKLVGDIDAVSVRQFQQALSPLLMKQPARIILDCTELKYINSRGIGMLVQSHRQAMVNRGKLVLVGVGDRLARALDLAQASDNFIFCDTQEEALGRFDN